MNRRNQKGQGATEYVVILGIIVAIAVALFTGPFKDAVNDKIKAIADDIKK